MATDPTALPHIRPMAPQDLDVVAAIEAATFPNPWPRDSLEYELLENPFCSAFIIEADERVAGYAYVWVIYEYAHLINFAIEEELRGKGYGEQLLVHLLRHAKSSGAQRIHLEVRENNEAAIRLYEKHGFTALGRGERYYSDGTAALFMEAVL